MRTIEQMVQQEINCCLSSLISTLAGGDARPGSSDLSALCDQALELASPVPDYEEAAIQAGWSCDGKRYEGYFHFHKAGQRTVFKANADAWQEICEFDGLEPVDSEVYEHWAVSQWLAEKLIALGEKVDTDFADLNVWARQNTGQEITADDVIVKIYSDMMKA